MMSLLDKVNLSLCITKHHAIKAIWRSGGIAPRILHLGTRWRRVVVPNEQLNCAVKEFFFF